MRPSIARWVPAAVLLFAAVLFISQDAWARGAGSHASSGGSHSSFSSGRSSSSSHFSSSPSSSGRSSSWGTSAPAHPSTSGSWGTSAPRTSTWGNPTAHPLGNADRALADKVRSSGTRFDTREDAVRSLRSRFGADYTAVYPVEPDVRPAHVPLTTAIDGQPYNIFYGPAYSGYGYYYGGRWRYYDPFLDPAMSGMLLRRHNYDYGPPPASRPAQTDNAASTEMPPSPVEGYGNAGPVVQDAPYPSSDDPSMLWVGFLVLVAIVVGYVIVKYVQAREWKPAPAYAGFTDAGTERSSAASDWNASAAPAPPVAQADPRDLNTAAFWKNVGLGAIVTLSDKLAMKDSLARIGREEGIRYVVRAVRRVTESRGLCEWIMLGMRGEADAFANQQLWFVAKVVDGEVAAACYEPVKDIAPGTRKEFIDRGDRWMFQQPEDEQHVAYNRLKYTVDMTRDVEEESGEVQVNYTQKPQGELQGECTEEPGSAGRPEPATLVEYTADRECDNPELLLLELGSSDDGGQITLMEGGPFDLSQLTLS